MKGCSVGVLATGLAMSAAFGEEMFGFSVKEVVDLPEVPGRMWRMEYAKNGAELVWLEREDENKTFAIAFKTIPGDDTGVAHIMEHSVLNGSEKFPVKEPFVELLKSSYATFINAWTSADCTTYPVATKNAKDYRNLVEVYLDAVFFPLSVKSDWAMRQEGWHYEYDGTNLTRNGVVYSEMKGVFGNPNSVAYRELNRLIYPDNTYGKVSGGDPAHVPELTFAQYQAFHRRFYHPSNARIFLDGRVDLKPTLALLDSYLTRFERRPADVAVPRQKPVSAAKTVPYACDEAGERTILMDGWVTGTFADRERILALDVLSDLLAGSNEAPLKKALLDAGLCRDCTLGIGGSEQMAVYLRVQNTSEAKAPKCRETVRTTLERLCREGLDAKRIAAILDRKEFERREQDSSQRGLRFLGEVMDSWLYGGRPAANLRMAEVFAGLRAKIGTGWFERLLKEAMLDNPHHGEVTLVPSKTLDAERRAAERAELAKLKAAMSPDELAKTAERAKALKAHQTAADRPEDLAKLPRLRLQDIPERGAVPEHEVVETDGVTVLRPKLAVNGIVYFDLCFSLAGLSDDELADAAFLAEALGELATENYGTMELRNELDGRLGGFWVSAESYQTGPRLVAHVSALESRKDDALRLLKEVLLKTRFDDAQAVARLRTQRRERLERQARSSGREFARTRVRRTFSEPNRVADLLSGVGQLRRLQTPATVDLKALAARVFVRTGLTMSLAGAFDAAEIRRIAGAWPVGGAATAKRDAASGGRASEGFVADGQVGYAAMAGRLPADVPFHGAQAVASKIVSLEYLWNEIRLKGGAYGGGLSVTPYGDVVWSSWRDPNPVRTLGVFRRSAEALKAFVDAGVPLEPYQVSTVKDTEPNLSPREEAAFACRMHFNRRTTEDIQRLRREMLRMTKDDLLSFARTLGRLAEKPSTCVFANEKLLAPCALERTERLVP